MKDLFPFESLKKWEKKERLNRIEEDLEALRNISLGNTPILYKEPTDLVSFRELLIQQQIFLPRLKAALQIRLEERHKNLVQVAQKLASSAREWQEQLKEQEETSFDRSELGHQPNTHHISSLLQQPNQQSSTSHRTNRRADVVRSEEEMNRVIQSLIEQDRDNPETRWLATAAFPPHQMAASSKCLFRDRFLDFNRQLVCTDERTPATSDIVESAWTEAEERIFIDRFINSPKNFRRISAALPFKTTAQCVRFYYRNKRRLNLKGLVIATQSESSLSGSTGSIASSRKRSVYEEPSNYGKRIK
jgi:hypothetical protein